MLRNNRSSDRRDSYDKKSFQAFRCKYKSCSWWVFHIVFSLTIAKIKSLFIIETLISNVKITGTVHAGCGYTGLNKILACLNIPTVSKTLYKRYEREVGPAIEEAAQDSCKQAAKEERRLVIENINKLCQMLYGFFHFDIFNI